MKSVLAIVPAAAVAVAGAQGVAVTGGQTSVALDFVTLETAAGLVFFGASDDVIAPGSLPDSVAFSINARDASDPLLATTFEYDASDFLGTFSGTIEHAGSILFNDGDVEVGNFTIGFDGDRAVGDASGFFVASTVGVEAILFDVATPSVLDATASGLTIEGGLLVSAEFASFLGDEALTGASVGAARVEAVPAPGAVAGLGLVGLLAARRRR